MTSHCPVFQVKLFCSARQLSLYNLVLPSPRAFCPLLLDEHPRLWPRPMPSLASGWENLIPHPPHKAFSDDFIFLPELLPTSVGTKQFSNTKLSVLVPSLQMEHKVGVLMLVLSPPSTWHLRHIHQIKKLPSMDYLYFTIKDLVI